MRTGELDRRCFYAGPARRCRPTGGRRQRAAGPLRRRARRGCTGCGRPRRAAPAHARAARTDPADLVLDFERLGPSAEPRSGGDQPARKLRRTFRTGLSTFRSTSTIDCQTSRAPAAAEHRDHQRRADEGRQDVVSAVAARIRADGSSGHRAAAAGPAPPPDRPRSRSQSRSGPGRPWHGARRRSPGHRRAAAELPDLAGDIHDAAIARVEG